MRIELGCGCGARAVFDDSMRTFVRDGGLEDERGRKYRVEVYADAWTERHKDCGARGILRRMGVRDVVALLRDDKWSDRFHANGVAFDVTDEAVLELVAQVVEEQFLGKDGTTT